MLSPDPNWIAPRVGQDWQDPNTQRAVDWLRGLVAPAEMSRRIDRAQELLTRAWSAWQRGEPAEMYDGRDLSAWYILQAESFARDRSWTVPEGVARIVVNAA